MKNISTPIKPGLFVAACLLLTVMTSSGSVLPYVSDFDALTLGPINGQDGWTDYASGTSTSAPIIADPTGDGRGQVLYIQNSGTSTPGTGVFGSVRHQFTGGGDSVVTLDVYGNNVSAAYAFPIIAIGGNGGQIANIEGLNTNEVFRLNNNNTYSVAGMDVNGGKWYSLTLAFNTAAQTYNFSATDGVDIVSLNNVPWQTGTSTNVAQIWFYPASGGAFPNGSGYFDNIVITVPEPSIALLLLGGVGFTALLRRPRRQNAWSK